MESVVCLGTCGSREVGNCNKCKGLKVGNALSLLGVCLYYSMSESILANNEREFILLKARYTNFSRRQ